MNGFKSVEFDSDDVPKGDYLGTFELENNYRIENKVEVQGACTHREFEIQRKFMIQREGGGHPAQGKQAMVQRGGGESILT